MTDEKDTSTEDLVAYLDGELSDERVVEIEKRLAADPALRQQLAELQKSFDLLDTLPHTHATNDFTRSTLELVVADAQREIRKGQKGIPKWLVYSVCGLVMFVAAAWGGQKIVRRYQENPTREIVQQIEIVDNANKYLSVKDINFLELLDEEELFTDATNGDSNSSDLSTKLFNSNDTYDQRLSVIQSLPDQQLKELERRVIRFQTGLSERERKRASDLHATLSQHPKRESLRRILDEFYDWLKTLGPKDRADLSQMNSVDAINFIREKRADQEQRVFGIADENRIQEPEDIKNVRKWFLKVRYGNYDTYRKIQREARKGNRHYIQVMMENEILLDLFFPESEINSIVEQLSPDSVVILDTMETFEDRRRLILQWCRAITSERVSTQAELEKIYDALPEAEKADLDSYSVDRRKATLESIFRSRQ